MRISDLYESESGKSFCLHHLHTHPDLTPALRMQMARQFNIIGWVEPAFRALVANPLSEMSADDAGCVGAYVVRLLASTRENLDLHRRALAFNTPPASCYMECPSEGYCTNAWSRVWWHSFGRRVLHPENPLTPREALAELQGARTEGMCTECLRKTILDNQSDTDVQELFDNSEQIITDAVLKLQGWIENL
jgi:hypothetical protein